VQRRVAIAAGAALLPKRHGRLHKARFLSQLDRTKTEPPRAVILRGPRDDAGKRRSVMLCCGLCHESRWLESVTCLEKRASTLGLRG